ncbi:hypothetical protein Z042_02070 [Chania multitudinisentens RB-25]|uniref:Carrier domain-containing protein n=1 Tax=Chania multitudinisentens RB-25 TaxID=1441930 RepID=W0LJT6_9GAMM|nr:condensation domain-containing protein [Chania multitudinisentens]AHG22597.1 hypothetical protein Z042_02070 [Chania multitudinisentens RB-25]
MLTLLNRLKQSGYAVWTEDHKIKLSRAGGEIEDEVRGQIRASREPLLACLEHNHIRSKSCFEQRNIFSVLPEKPRATFAQKRLLYLEQFNQQTDVYNIPVVLELLSGLDVEVFKKSMAAIVQRHEILRSYFQFSERGPGEVYLKIADTPFGIDEKTVTADSLQATLSPLLAVHHELALRPPLQVTLLNVDNGRRLAAIVFHHSIFDGWSLEVFLHELVQHCLHYQQGDPLTLPELPVQYRDVSEGYMNRMSGEVLAHHLAYWREKLKDHVALRLPTDRPCPTMVDYRGADFFFDLSADLSLRIREAAKRYGVSLYTLLLTGFNILLSKYTGQQDILVGTLLSNRHHAELTHSIGYFVNALAVRNQVEPESTLQQLIIQVKEELVQTQTYQELSFIHLVYLLNIERSTSQNPVFQVQFTVQGFGAHDVGENTLFRAWPVQKRYDVIRYDSRLERKTAPAQGEYPFDEAITYHSAWAEDIDDPEKIRWWPNNEQYDEAEYKLNLFIDDSGEALRCNLNYAMSLYERATIQRLAHYYCRIMVQIVANPVCKIKDILLLDRAEQQQVVRYPALVEYSEGSEPLLHARFSEQARLSPDKIALLAGEQQMTYAELEQRSNQMARYLRRRYFAHQDHQLNVGALIALQAEPGLEMIVGLLGILKAGAAYLLIAPNLPPEQVLQRLHESGAAMLLTQPDVLTAPQRHDLIGVELGHRHYRVESTEPLILTLQAEGLACICYPPAMPHSLPGATYSHRNMLQQFSHGASCFAVSADDTWLLAHAAAAGDGQWELWGALLSGGTLVVPGFLELEDTRCLVQLCERHRVSMLSLTPSAFICFSQRAIAANSPLSALRYVICSGEVLNTAWLMPWWEHYGDTSPEVVNMYRVGADFVAMKSLSPEQAGEYNSVGKPLASAAACILDAELTPVPLGVTGDLYLGEAFSSEVPLHAFVPGVPGKIAWRKTGDRACWLTHGELAWLSRGEATDIPGGWRQTAEIERCLASFPGLDYAVVVAGKSADTYPFSAYCLAEQPLVMDEVTTYLGASLPGNMVPIAVCQIEELPLDTYGRRDDQALFALQPKRPSVTPFIAPEGQREQYLASVFCEALGVNQLGRDDNFLLSGASSLNMIMACHRLNKELNQHVTLKSLYQYATIARLANYLNLHGSGQGQLD